MISTSYSDCLICRRIAMVLEDTNPYFVAEMQTGYVVLGDYQYWKGYTLFLCKSHVQDLHDLEPAFKMLFLEEMAIVAEAVFCAFQPRNMNYELLGNSERHLHWHLFPRYADEPQANKPVWVVDNNIRYSNSAQPSPDELEGLKQRLLTELQKLIFNK